MAMFIKNKVCKLTHGIFSTIAPFRGFYGNHRCGVTLLSAPPKPTILVSAAHCNFICKDEKGNVVKTCCCRKRTEPNECGQVLSRNKCNKNKQFLTF